MKKWARHNIFKLIGIMSILMLLLPASTKLVAAQNITPASAVTANVPTNQIILKYKASTQASLSPAQGSQMGRLSSVTGLALTYLRSMAGNAIVLKLPDALPLNQVQNISSLLMSLPEVQYAEPDQRLFPVLSPNDPYYAGGNQWDLNDATGGINAPAAWDVTTGTSGVVVADVDTGLTNHADLAGRMVSGTLATSGYDFIEDVPTANDGDGRDPDPSDPGDWVTTTESNNPTGPFYGCPSGNSSWHGTHTAGTLGAASNNALGVAGINWVSKLLIVRAMGKCGGYDSDIIDGITWAAGLPVTGVPDNANPAKVINLSLGGPGTCSTAWQNAVTAVNNHGAVVVAAAGNSSTNVSGFYPANCNGVIAVAATGRTGSKAWYSDYGTLVKISAPGGDDSLDTGVLSTLNTGTTVPGSDTYAYYEGTSMATPHVTGVVSLMFSVNSSLTPAQVLSILQSTARPFPSGSTCLSTYLNRCGSGLLDAGAAVRAAVPAVSFNKSSPANAATGQPLNPTLSWGSAGAATSYEYCIDTTNNSTCDGNWTSAGSNTSVNLAGLNPSVTYYWQVRYTNNGVSPQADNFGWWSFTTGNSTPTSTITPTFTYTSTFTTTPTFTDTATFTITPSSTFTLTNTATITSSITPTNTWTATSTKTPTITPTLTATLVNAVTVTVLDTDGLPVSGLKVYPYSGGVVVGSNKITNTSGQAVFSGLTGSFRFQAQRNSTNFWSDTADSCTVPGCTSATVTVTKPLTVTVLDTDGVPQAGLKVYAFSGGAVVGGSKITDGNGQVVFSPPIGSYRFDAQSNGGNFWSATSDNCTVPGCTSASVTVPKLATNTPTLTATNTLTPTPTTTITPTLTVTDTLTPTPSTTMTPTPAVTDTLTPTPTATATLTPTISVTFTPSRTPTTTLTSTATLANSVTVTVLDTDGIAVPGLKVYTYTGTSVVGSYKTTNINGQVVFSGLTGSFRFQAQRNSTNFWSDTSDSCTVPGCTSASVIVTKPLTVTVLDTDGVAQSGLKVYAFSGGAVVGGSKVTDVNGRAVFSPPIGSYRFDAQSNGGNYWSDTSDSCIVPGCTSASVTVPKLATNTPTLTATNTLTPTPTTSVSPTPTVTDTLTPTPTTTISPTPTATDTLTPTPTTSVSPTPTVTDTLTPTPTTTISPTPTATDTLTPTPSTTISPTPTATDTLTPTPTTTVTFTPSRTPTNTPTPTATLANSVLVTVLDTDGIPISGLKVYAYSGGVVVGSNKITNSSGQAVFTGLTGSFRFQAQRNSTNFWSDTSDSCSVPGCTSASVTVTKPLTVTVLDTDGVAQSGLKVYAFSGGVVVGSSKVTDVNGRAVFSPPIGSYRFDAQSNGGNFWSDTSDSCTVPGCTSASVTVTKPVTVTVVNTIGVAQPGLIVYAYSGITVVGSSKTTDVNGQVVFALPVGSYNFRATKNGLFFWSSTCTIPGSTSASVTVSP